MFVVVGYSATCLFLPSIVLCESLSKKLVILFSDVLSAVGNVILYPFAVHILGDENSVVVFDYPSSILKEIESVLLFTSLIVRHYLLSLLPFTSAVRLFFGV